MLGSGTPRPVTSKYIMDSSPGRRLLTAFRVLFAAALLFTLAKTLWPHAHPHVGGPNIASKIGNCAAFAVLTFVAMFAFPRLKLLQLGEILSFLAAGIEVLQELPAVHRDANIFDWLIETGVIAIVLALGSAPKSPPPSRRDG